MDPINRGPEEHGHDNDGGTREGGRRDPLTPVTGPVKGGGPAGPTTARTAQIVSGDLLLTINPIDGSEIEPCPPGELPARPRKRTADERADLARVSGPPLPAGPAAPPLPLLERQEERERLVQLLARGRSARLTGPAGSGRTTLLDAVAGDCADIAPDGVVRLSGYRRTATELLHELFATVHHATHYRPDRATLLDHVHDIGAVVVVDDLEIGGAALDELLDATPECAFLFAATPDVPAPTAEAHLEEVTLAGLGRGSTLELLERVVDRALTDEEANWAGDLWFESEGLPLRFVQAGALLRQRDTLRAGQGAFDPFGAGPANPDDEPDDPDDIPDSELPELPLPTLGEGAAPAALLASRLGPSARETLRLAVALGGEVPHPAHLPALVGDTHADAALGELVSCGLLTPVGPRYRLAAQVLAQLEAAGYGEGAADRAHTVAQHYAWWAGHPSVTPERAGAEADALLASMTALLPSEGAPPGQNSDDEDGHIAAAVLLARSATPAFAAGLHWGAWERALRTGQEAARIAGEVAEEAYFHHELGVLALCAGNLDRARAELEASIGMRGALADKRGTVAGRRALALVADRAGGPLAGRVPAGDKALPVHRDASASQPGGIPVARKVSPFPDQDVTLVTRQDTSPGGMTKTHTRWGFLGGARRNAVAVGAGALLVAVLGTVITLGATSGGDERPGSERVSSDPSTGQDTGDDGYDTDEPVEDPTQPGSTGKPETPNPSGSATPRGGGSSTGGGSTKTSGGSPSSSGSASTGGTTTGGTTTSGGGSTSGSTTTGGSPSGSPSSTGGTSSGGGTTTTGGTDPAGGTTTGGTDPTGGTTTGGTDPTGGTTTGGTDPTGGTTTGGTDPAGGTTTGGTDPTGGDTNGSPSNSGSAA